MAAGYMPSVRGTRAGRQYPGACGPRTARHGPRASGSPIFFVQDGQLMVVALMQGHLGNAGRRPRSPAANGIPNAPILRWMWARYFPPIPDLIAVNRPGYRAGLMGRFLKTLPSDAKSGGAARRCFRRLRLWLRSDHIQAVQPLKSKAISHSEPESTRKWRLK